MTIIEDGFRTSFDLEGITHDLDDKAHTVTVDYPFERMDAYRSDFGKGWCDDYLAGHRPVMVVHHNPRDLIGRAVSYQNLGDRAQLVGKFSDFDRVPLASEYFAHIRDDEIPGWSYHYRNGKGMAHPSGMRGAVRYTKADMPEFGPTPFPAIPGAGAVGLRSEEPAMSVPTIEELIELQKLGVLNDEGLRSAITEHYPNLREHITVSTAPKSVLATQQALEAIVADLETTGLRAMTITIGDDGSVSTGGASGDEDPSTLASAVDSCLDKAAELVADLDTSTLPDNVQEAISLMQAAGVAVDELLVVMGVDDPDADEGQRSAAEIDDLPDSDFAYIEDGGTKDGSGKTIPRKFRHYPVQDKAHVQKALQLNDSPFFAKAKPKIMAAAKKFGVESGQRSEDDQATEAAARLARLRVS
ncbi:MAG: Tsac [Acidimicrobiaceae bacterium]|nr:Tsac [Acidimicrobiaceae bacterium]